MKYELTDERMNVDGITAYRIKALEDFGLVTKGTLGGFIQSESNLSQEGNCWVYGISTVIGECVIEDNATVAGSIQLAKSINLKGDLTLAGDYSLLGDYCINGGVVSIPPLSITGMWFDLIITDQHMGIACQHYDKDFWRGLTEEQADAIGVEGNFKPDSIWVWWQEHGASILAVAEVHWAKME